MPGRAPQRRSPRVCATPNDGIVRATMVGRLVVVHLAFFASVAIEYGYLPLAFAARGLTESDIGLLYTGRTLAVVLFVPWLMRVVAKTGRPHATLRVLAVLGAAVALGLPAIASLGSAMLLYWPHALMRAPVIPLIDGAAIEAAGIAGFGRVRRFGTVGYGLTVLLFGLAVASWSLDDAGRLAIVVYIATCALYLVATLGLPQDARAITSGLPTTAPVQSSAAPASRLPAATIALFAWSILHWAAVDAYNVFFALRVRELGLGAYVPGAGVAVASVAEIAMLSLLGRWVGRSRPAMVVGIALASSSLRWALMSVTTHPALLIALQALHAFSFALWYAQVLDVLAQHGPSATRAQRQGWFTAIVLGGGGILGSAGGGLVMRTFGGGALFGGAALLDALALVMALVTARTWSAATTGPVGAQPAASSSST